MKKFIQIYSVLGLLFLFSAVLAHAQSVQRFEGQIPFDFNIGQKHYPAGNYVIRIAKDSLKSTVLMLEDTEGNLLQTVLVRESGDVSTAEPQLVFNRYQNQRFLSKIVTSRFGFSVSMSSNEKQVARNQKKSSQTQVASFKSSR